MKKIALSLGASAAALAFLAVAPSVSVAQDSTARPAPTTPANPSSPNATGQQATQIPAEYKPLFDGITLTDTQNQQIAQIATRHATPAGRPDSSKAGMGAGAVDQHMAAAKEFRAVLTPDQQKTFDRNLDKVKGSWGSKRNY
ncbi:MAG: hypothetical protein U0133_12515 [Gemmatimonadales bacterium]